MLFSDVAKYYEKIESISSRLGMIDVLAEMLGNTDRKEIRSLIYMTQGVLSPPFEAVRIGIAEKLAESSISLATGFSLADVESHFRKSGDLGSTAEELVKKTRLKGIKSEKLSILDAFRLMSKIATTSGEGSKDLKIKTLAGILAASEPLEARYLVRFALGTLRLGAGDATILEALSKNSTGSRDSKVLLESAYNICGDLGKVAEVLAVHGMRGIENFKVELFSPIRPALAERMNTADEILKKMGGTCSAESKYDGLRAQVHVDKKASRVEIFSRNLERLTEMFPEIAKAALSEVDASSAILEGEAIAYDEVSGEFHAFQETIQRKRKHMVEEKSAELPLKLFSFDIMYLNGESYIEKPYSERRSRLESILHTKGSGKSRTIMLADRIITSSPKELELYFDKAIEHGLEGIVAKDLSARYVAGARKFSWIKMKRSYKSELSDSIDVVIIGYYLGKGARAEFGFGGVLASVYNKKRDMFETITKIGTGFTEAQMEYFRKLLEKTRLRSKPARVDSEMEPDFWVDPRYVVTVRADEITRSPMHTCGRSEGHGAGYALRFPRIIGEGIREDKSPEDSTSTKEIIEMFGAQKKTKVSA